jgi:diguanylate cyclase (GGDEF)-like protein
MMQVSFLATLVVSGLVMMVTLALAWQMFGRPRHALSWSLAFGCSAAQWVLHAVSAVAPKALPFVSWLSSTLIGLTYVLLVIGVRQRAHLPERRGPLAAGLAVMALFLGYTVTVVPGTGAGMLVCNAFSAAVLPLALAGLRVRGRRSNASERMLFTCLAVLWVMMLGYVGVGVALLFGHGSVALYGGLLMFGLPPICIALSIGLCFVLTGDLAEQLKVMVARDPLTGALNRRGLEEAADRLIAAAPRRACPLTLVVADLDRFKAINDQHGHAAGDRVLCRFVEAALAVAGPDDLVARFGGDEFCLLIEGDARRGQAVVGALRERLGGEVTASFGLAAWRDGDTLAQMLLRADRALYRAKHEGRDQAMLEAA